MKYPLILNTIDHVLGEQTQPSFIGQTLDLVQPSLVTRHSKGVRGENAIIS